MTDAPTEKWTELELLPEWEEEFYDVYTARKHGKWVMLKTLKKQYAEDPKFQSMLHREFEVRYNLAHSHIVMINDLEEIPGLGLCIITDDVYGDSLAKLIERKEVTPDIVRKIARNLADAIDYMQTNHIVHEPVTPQTVIFTEKIRNLKVINVGFDQKNELEPTDAIEDIRAYGRVLLASINACPDADPRLRSIAERCIGSNPYRTVQQLQMAVSGNSLSRLYSYIIIFLLAMIAILCAVIVKLQP